MSSEQKSSEPPAQPLFGTKVLYRSSFSNKANQNPAFMSFERQLHKQSYFASPTATNLDWSSSTVTFQNIGYSVSDAFFTDFLPDEKAALDLGVPDADLLKKSHAGVLKNIRRGKHLLEYAADPTVKDRYFTYRADHDLPIDGNIGRSLQNIALFRDMKLVFELVEIDLNHDQSKIGEDWNQKNEYTRLRENYFNFCFKFRVGARGTKGQADEFTTQLFHDGEQNTMGSILNVHFFKLEDKTASAQSTAQVQDTASLQAALGDGLDQFQRMQTWHAHAVGRPDITVYTKGLRYSTGRNTYSNYVFKTKNPKKKDARQDFTDRLKAEGLTE